MGTSEYLAKRFIDKEICVTLGNDVETITYAEVWAHSKAFFRGFAKCIEDGWLELDVPDVGPIHIRCDSIEMVWEPSFSWRKAVRASMTDKPISPSGK